MKIDMRMNPTMRMRMAERNAAQSTLPQEKREVVYDAASGTTFDAQRMSRSAASAQKKMKKLQYNFKLISSQIMRAKTSSSAARAVTSARRKTAELRRKRKSGEYDDEELNAAIMHALSIERIAKKHVKNIQAEERAERSAKLHESGQPKETPEHAENTVPADREELSPVQSDELPEELLDIQQELADSLGELPRGLAEEMEQLMQEYGDMMSETMEQMDDELLDSAIVTDTDMSPEDIKALKQKHRAKEMQEIAKADAKYLKALFDKYAADRQQAANGVSQMVCEMSGMGGVVGVIGMTQSVISAGASATASDEGNNVDVSI